jgi:hypothetical protein
LNCDRDYIQAHIDLFAKLDCWIIKSSFHAFAALVYSLLDLSFYFFRTCTEYALKIIFVKFYVVLVKNLECEKTLIKFFEKFLSFFIWVVFHRLAEYDGFSDFFYHCVNLCIKYFNFLLYLLQLRLELFIYLLSWLHI